MATRDNHVCALLRGVHLGQNLVRTCKIVRPLWKIIWQFLKKKET